MRVKRDHNCQSLALVIEKLMKSYRLDGRMREMEVIKAWELCLGKVVAKRTADLYIKQKTLYVKLTSAPLREELLLNKTHLITVLNEKAGGAIIEDIHFS